ncbi:MAG: hypothetical protein U0T80_03685 [Flavobacteriaceae bacterium]
MEIIFDNQKDITKNLDYYLNNIEPMLLDYLKNINYWINIDIAKQNFKKYLERINEIRNNNSLNYWIFQGSPKYADTVMPSK